MLDAQMASCHRLGLLDMRVSVKPCVSPCREHCVLTVEWPLGGAREHSGDSAVRGECGWVSGRVSGPRGVPTEAG